MTFNMDNLKEDIRQIFEEVKGITEGNVASYIPQLADVNPDLFGVSVCTVKGEFINFGDTKEEFCLQSCSKIITYLLACQLVGTKKVHQHIGHEPSGRAFNDYCLNSSGQPHNPMINAGAIMSIALIKPEEQDMALRYGLIQKFMKDLAGNVGFQGYDNGVYLSERGHAHKNRALANIMMGENAFPKGTNINDTLDLYFQICSVTTNAETAALISACLANSGVSPISDKKIVSPVLVKNCLTLMSTCGMYDFSGGFAFEVGIPAKSGVSGCIMLVIPKVAGICIWSPPLDDKGNSVKGVEFATRLIQRYPQFHTFYSTQVSHNQQEFDYLQEPHILVQKLIQLASTNNLEDIDKLVTKYNSIVNINHGDYDSRTPLHLAAANGHSDMVVYLIKLGAIHDVKDRFGNTPYHEASKERKTGNSYDNICLYLEQLDRDKSDTASQDSDPVTNLSYSVTNAQSD